MEQKRVCNKCKAILDLTEFYVDSRYRGGLTARCKECIKEAYNANKERASRNARIRRLRQVFGMTEEEYDRLLSFQDGKCFVCKKECKTGRRLAIDHDHNTGHIRGLLCNFCNRNVIGRLAEDKIEVIYSYIKNPPADAVFGIKRKVPDGMEKPKRKRKRRIVKRSGTRIPRAK